MTQRNPLVPRMEYVAKTYGDWVTMATLSAWAEATGEHRLREDIASEPKTTILQELRDLHRRRSGMGMDTRFDRYLPWIAREFNRMWKFRLKASGFEDHMFSGMDMKTMRAYPGLYNLDALQQGEINALANEALRLRHAFRSIVDWAEAEKVDLNKYQWPQALSEAHAWGANRPADDVTQGRVVYTFDDGWTVQELRSEEQLKLEGAAMQHCVGEDAYEGQVKSGRVRIFSLRDPKGHPHATMEWHAREEYVLQLKGKQNDSPKPEYLGRMVRFRLDALPSTLARHLPDFKPGVRELFEEEYLGAWAIRQPGWETRKPSAQKEQTVVVYDVGGSGFVPYDLGELNELVDETQANIEGSVGFDFQDDEEEDDEAAIKRRDKQVQMHLRDWAQETSLSGQDRPGPAPIRGTAYEPPLDWSVWQITSRGPFGDTDDEMIQELRSEDMSIDSEFIPPPQRSSAAANPRGRKARTKSPGKSPKQGRVKLKPAGLSPMQLLKRKLMR